MARTSGWVASCANPEADAVATKPGTVANSRTAVTSPGCMAWRTDRRLSAMARRRSALGIADGSRMATITLARPSARACCMARSVTIAADADAAQKSVQAANAASRGADMTTLDGRCRG